MNKLLAFDLDGTLIDSIGGIANSVNLTRRDYNLSALPVELIKSFVGDGARKLLERSLTDTSAAIPFEEALQKMLQYYVKFPDYKTVLYEGVKNGLQRLKEHNFIITVISNKPQAVSDKLLKKLQLSELIADNIGGGGDFPLKPDPSALNYLMQKYSVSTENTWVIGDNHTDIFLAANAGTNSIFCAYGFGHKADSISSFDADSFSQATDILLNLF